VVAALEAARAIRERGGSEQVGVDVVSFADEEGTFLGTLGSMVFCGEIGDADIAGARNAAGMSLTDALHAAGYDGREIVRLDPERHTAFVELHIEQGPRLEAAGVTIGVVDAIVSMRRLAVQFTGRADHAGTTPMDMRADAGAAAIRFAAGALDAFEQAGGAQTVWNIGRMTFEPGGGNVVPSRTEVLVEYRDASDEVLERLDAVVAEVAAAAGDRYGVPWESRPVVRMAGCDMSTTVADALQAAADTAGVSVLRLPSGAGHDSMILRRHVPTGMLFVPSIGGRSHDVAEDTAEEDLVVGVQVLADAVERLMQEAAPPAGPTIPGRRRGTR
jgi:N-carbamoyl-L-amino-acid hydrolase